MTTLWFKRWVARPNAAVRVLCFPLAGGSALHYRKWATTASSSLEVLAVELPGRGSRADEPLAGSMEEMTAGLVESIRPEMDKPLAVVGHCMGALVALEFAYAFRAAFGHDPLLFVAAGCPAPQLVYTEVRRSESDEELAVALREHGGVAPALLEDERYRERILAPMRADIAIINGYLPPTRDALDAKIRAYWGADDPAAKGDDVTGWSAMTAIDFMSRKFPGGHLFIEEMAVEVLGALVADIDDARVGRRSAASATPRASAGDG